MWVGEVFLSKFIACTDVIFLWNRERQKIWETNAVGLKERCLPLKLLLWKLLFDLIFYKLGLWRKDRITCSNFVTRGKCFHFLNIFPCWERWKFPNYENHPCRFFLFSGWGALLSDVEFIGSSFIVSCMVYRLRIRLKLISYCFSNPQVGREGFQ